jgi:hypothetical protein
LLGEVAERLVWTDGVVDLLPSAQFAVQLVEFERAGGDLMELLGVGALGAFGPRRSTWAAGREHEQQQAPLLTGLLELPGELTAAINLHGADREGHALGERGEELGGQRSGGAGVHFQYIPARDG